MNYISVLNRNEMKSIKAGEIGCRVFYSDDLGNYWGQSCYTVGEAQYLFNNDSEATGYCCASCGQAGFSNTTSCSLGDSSLLDPIGETIMT